ncbi:hypothetical protein BH23PLA1_BH23PLA1_03510 [soil metagenome]
MNRLVIAGMLALAASGCSQTRSALPPQAGHAAPIRPLALAPIHETINQGPFPESSDLVIQSEGWQPGINGSDPIEPPRLSRTVTPPVPRVEPMTETQVVSAPATPSGRPLAEAALAVSTLPLPQLPKIETETPGSGDSPAAPEDEAVLPASAERGKPVSEWAARVNEDVITMNELRTALKERMRQLPEGQEIPPEAQHMLIDSVLDWLVDRTLIIQQARREELKDPKAWENINQAAEKVWEEEMLGPMLKRYQAGDKYELARTLNERGDSLDDMRESFKLDFISRQFLVHKVRPKVYVDLPELRSYYQEHRDHESFQNREKIEWREVVVYPRNHPDASSARSKAEAALARLARGEDFEAIARELSEGPTASQGGQHSTSPGSHAVDAVNQALGSLPIGQLSPVIEGSGSYHVLKVERRLQAGPKPFEDVQKPIRDLLEKQKESEHIDEYLSALHKGAVIRTIFQEREAKQD